MQDSIQELRKECDSLKKENAELKFALQRLTPQTNIPFVDIHLVEHCNLDCFCCNHFSQLAEEEYTNLNTYEADLKQLTLVTGGG